MKNIKLYVVMALIAGLSLTSCESYFGDINVDPDNPTAVTPNVLLPQIQVRLAYTIWGDASRYVGIYNQHIDGTGRQFAVIQNYGITPGDLNTMWGSNFYSSIMMDNRQLLAIAEEGGYGHYVGVSKAIEAYSMMMITDLFGDAPYTEAFQGTEVIQPAFDSQESIYNAIFALITSAKADLAGDDGGFPIGADDLMYGGSADAWTKFLNVLEARGKLHLAKRNGASAYTDALAALAGGFDSAADEARIQFGSGATEAAPWFQYIDQRDDIDVSPRFVARLQALSDPRESTYGAVLDLPHPIFVAARAVPIISFSEAKFIEAECALQSGDDATAHQAYLDGIAASFDETGQSADYAAYVAQTDVDPGSGSLTLEQVMTQKHIALFGNYEAFSDWRRTGFPDLTASPNTGNEVPRRLPYAENEILSNENTPSPADVTIFSRVWWDN
ncbi:MAG: SusD/RagB family nutrient-binding outer membrane lipoprotein [Saprospiraceae bacterium]